jgi:hypothetical protein
MILLSEESSLFGLSFLISSSLRWTSVNSHNSSRTSSSSSDSSIWSVAVEDPKDDMVLATAKSPKWALFSSQFSIDAGEEKEEILEELDLAIHRKKCRSNEYHRQCSDA